MRKALTLLVIVVFSGCGQGANSVTYYVGQKGGNATLSLGGTTLIFEGIPTSEADVENKMSGFFKVAGSGTTRGKSSVDGVVLAYDYANGVTQLSFGEYKFKLTDNGTKLVFSDQAFDLGTKTIRVAKDGTARIAD